MRCSPRSLVLTLGAGSALWVGTTAAQSPKPVEIGADTMAGVGEMLAPYRKPDTPPTVTHALDVLQHQHLLQAPGPHAVDDPTERLGRALQLGSRTRQFLPELAAVSNAIGSSNDAAARSAIATLWQKAGRAPPSGAAMDKLLQDARAARAAAPAPSQHLTLNDPGGKVTIDHSPAAGGTKVAVVADGPDGEKQRTVFHGEQVTRPKADGSGLENVMQSDPPRVVDQTQADAEKANIAGRWTDQEGLAWDLVVNGNEVSATSTSRNGHAMTYASQWSLGELRGKHIVNDPADIGGDLPDDVRMELARTWHPPFTIELEYQPADGTLRGTWISGQVTYSGMTHNIRIVEDPTWDKPLILTRGIKVAQGGRNPQEGP